MKRSRAMTKLTCELHVEAPDYMAALQKAISILESRNLEVIDDISIVRDKAYHPPLLHWFVKVDVEQLT